MRHTDRFVVTKVHGRPNREKLGFSGMEKAVAFDHSDPLADLATNEAGTPPLNEKPRSAVS
jgi:hypothetical protein